MRLGAVDLGGSHVAAGVVSARAAEDAEQRLHLEGVVSQRFPAGPQRAARTLDLVATTMAAALAAVPDRAVEAWALAVPGPFDFAGGVSLITGLAKLEELYRVDVRAALAERLGADPASLHFVHDGAAAALGEWCAGAGGGVGRFVLVTLGTGLGSGFVEGGRVLTDDERVPPGGLLGDVAFRGARADDWISTRGLLRRVDDEDPPEQLAARARAGDPAVAHAFRALGDDLVAVLTPWVERFRPNRLAIGGGLAAAWDLIVEGRCAPLADRTAVVRAARPQSAALLGAPLAAGLVDSSAIQVSHSGPK